MNPEEPFVFSTEWRLVALTGRKARNLGHDDVHRIDVET